jgi:5-deoxy-glucuronate isomerase
LAHLFKSKRDPAPGSAPGSGAERDGGVPGPASGPVRVVGVTPETAGWKYLSFQVIALKAGVTYREDTAGKEVALVPLNGRGSVEIAPSSAAPESPRRAQREPGIKFELVRHNIFGQVPHVLYVPPRQEIVVTALTDFEFSTGSAPAEGKYATRLFRPDEMRQEIRGGGAARRQVNHILAHPLPAERLILYEVYVPGGMWSGWPPHCHDGNQGSPYLEETYYYRFDTKEGFGIQRNYRAPQPGVAAEEGSVDVDVDLFAVHDGDLTLVTQGYHPVVAAPGSNMYFLNYQAGDLLDGARGTPPYEDPGQVWIKENWERNLLKLPIGEE